MKRKITERTPLNGRDRRRLMKLTMESLFFRPLTPAQAAERERLRLRHIGTNGFRKEFSL